MTVGWSLCFTAAAYAAYTLNGSWPPRLSFHTCSSDRSATSAFSSGVLKKCSRTYAPSLLLKSWYCPSTHSSIRFSRMPASSLANSASHAEQDPLEFLDDLAVATHWAVESLQVAVDDEDQVVETFAATQRNCAERLRLVAFAVAEERPDLAAFGLREAAALEVLEKARLVDRHQRTQSHRHRGELPELGHQPRMRVRRYALAVAFLAEVLELLVGKPSLDVGASVDPRCDMALHIDQVAAVIAPRTAPEVTEADVVQQC